MHGSEIESINATVLYYCLLGLYFILEAGRACHGILL